VRYADVVGTLALILVMGGTAYAATALPKNSVGSRQIKNNQVQSKDIRDGGVAAKDLGAGSVGTTQLQTGAVGSGQLSPSSVGSAQVADESLTTADLQGADLTGTVFLSVPANSCGTMTLNVQGAQAGDAGFLTWRGTPPNLVVGPLYFDATDHAKAQVCNPTGSLVSVSDLGIRVLTFRG